MYYIFELVPFLWVKNISNRIQFFTSTNYVRKGRGCFICTELPSKDEILREKSIFPQNSICVTCIFFKFK